MKIFFNDFIDKQSVFNQFTVSDEQKRLVSNIILASYTYVDYSGDAFVLFQGHDGKYYEVNGSHCSCNGLEGQWNPEEILVAELQNRRENGRFLEYGEHGDGPGKILDNFIDNFNFNKKLDKLLENESN